MKKLISIVLLLAMVLGLFAGCGKNKDEETTGSNLQNAVDYLIGMYQTSGKDEAIVITADLDVLKAVVVDGVSYNVEWSVEITEGAADSVTISESKKANHVKLDIPLHSGEDILFTATATVSDESGNTQAAVFNYKVEGVLLAGAGMTMEELVEAAYALEEDTALEGLAVLTGEVTMINTPYDEGYQNVTCTIVVEGCADRPIKCYRLKGDGADTLAIGDTITVSGTLKNYKGNIQFDAGCMIDEITKGGPAPEAPADPLQIVEEAYALGSNETLPYTATLTGTIVSIDTAYDAGYQNLTCTIAVAGAEDKPIKCYRLKGEGADRLAQGDVITVTGFLTNYNGVIEFAQGCTMDAIVTGGTAVAPTDQLVIVDEAYALAPEASLPYSATLTGVITTVDTAYDATYKNITVTITVAGREQKPIQCYRLKGDGVETLAAGDIVTVSGGIKNYGGKIQLDVGTLVSVTKGDATVTKPATEVEIVDQAYKLQRDQALPYTATLTGKVTGVKEVYNSQYKNITVVIKVPGRENLPLICYRLKGTDVDKIAVNDTITVTGIIKNYNGSIQFDTGCNLDKRISGGGTPITQETDPLKIVDMAYALAKDTEMSYDVTLSGKVISIKDAYDSEFKNISVMFQVAGRESKPILIYRLKGDNVDKIAANDTITVVGRLKNYNGTVEMVNGTMTARTSGGGTAIKQETDPAKIMAEAKKLAENAEMAYDVSLSGKVTSIDEAYDSEFKNVTATISVTGTSDSLKLYRLKGDGVEKLAVGDTITANGRLKNYYGVIEMVNCTMTARTSGGGQAPVAQTDYKKIVDEAYALANGASLSYTATLEGKITELQSPYDASFKNMTVVITISGREDKPILCYRMKGDNIGNHLCVGDTITVEGKIKNYNGTIEFDAGCQMTARKAGSVSKPTDPKKIVDAAFALGENAVLPYFATLTGTVKSIDEAYSADYKNVTLTMTVQGSNGAKDIICYRLKGDAAATVAVGNTITVTGAIKRFVRDKDGVREDKVEFDSGCVLESLQKSSSLYVHIPAETVVDENVLNNSPVQARAVTNTAQIMADAFALPTGGSMSYEATLTGKITKIDTPYNSSYKNITVTIAVPGYESKPMLCYRIKGDGAEKLAVGDTITVTGTIINYNGTVEFQAGSTLDKVVSGGGVAIVAPSDPKKIVDEAFALAGGASLPYSAKLTGKIVSIDSEYDPSYKNITVTIEVEGSNGKKHIECYRLKGTGAENLTVGDVIVVEGTIQRYIRTDEETGEVTQDKVEFVSASLIEINPEVTTPETPSAAIKLYCQAPASWTACYIYTWDSSNAATTGAWPGSPMTKEADGLWSYEVPAAAANVIFNDGNGNQSADMAKPTDNKVKYVYETATWEALSTNNGGNTSTVPTDPKQIVAEAYALENGAYLPYEATLTGKITSIDYAYSATSGDITVTITVEGKALKCYRMTGGGIDQIAVGDTITVKGKIKNYNGTIEFDKPVLSSVNEGANKAPGTGDFSMIAPAIVLIMATTALVVLNKKKETVC